MVKQDTILEIRCKNNTQEIKEEIVAMKLIIYRKIPIQGGYKELNKRIKLWESAL